MNSDFSRVMTLLRKERSISQKQAAIDLGISQGLLSHYEKGKRECGLDFLVKAADYYNVSSDYLLGRSPEPQGKTISYDDIPEESDAKEKIGNGGVMVTFNKKLITNSISVLFSLLSKCKNSCLIKEVSSYLMIAVYQMFRIVYSANAKNDENFFTINKVMSSGASNAAMDIAKSKAELSVSDYAKKSGEEYEDELYITTSTLSQDYPNYYSSMVNLIKNSEAKIHLITEIEKQ